MKSALPNSASFRQRLTFLRLASLVSLAGLIPVQSFALAEFWEGALRATAAAGLTWDSSPSGVFQERDGDYRATFSPSLSFTRDRGFVDLNVRTGASVVRFLDLEGFDRINYDASVNLTARPSPDSPLSGSFSATFSDSEDVDDSLGARVEGRSWRFNAAGAYRYSPKTSFTASVSTSIEEREEFTDSGDYRFSGGISYRIRPTVSLTGNYRISFLNSDGRVTDPDFPEPVGTEDFSDTSHAFSLGVSMPVTAKISGNASIGYQFSDFSDGLFASAGLSYAFRPRTSFNLNLSRDVSSSARSSGTTRTSISVGATQAVGERLSFNASAGYTESEFDTLDFASEFFNFSLRGSFIIRRNWDASLAYTFRDRSSDFDTRESQRSQITFETAYTF